MPLEILVHHGHNTNGKIAGNTATYLKESNAFACTVRPVPICQPHHVFNPAFHGGGFHLVLYNIRSKNISHRAVFPPANNDRKIFSAAAIIQLSFVIDLIMFFQYATEQHFIHELMRKISFAFYHQHLSIIYVCVFECGGMLLLQECKYQ